MEHFKVARKSRRAYSFAQAVGLIPTWSSSLTEGRLASSHPLKSGNRPDVIPRNVDRRLRCPLPHIAMK